MIPTFLGMLMLLAAVGLVGVGFLVVLAGAFGQRPELRRVGVRIVGGTLAGYGLAWGLSVGTSRLRTYPVGEEIGFCGVDCHLHVSVAKAVQGADLGVTLKFRSDARGEPEYPSHLSFAVITADGRSFLPSDGMIAEPLAAGATIVRDFHFAVPRDAPDPRLVVRWNGWLDYLVPGDGNAVVQGRRQLELGNRN